MQDGSDRRKHSRSKKAAPQTLRIAIEDRAGAPKREIVAKLIDTSESGFRIGLTGPLVAGAAVWVDRDGRGGSGLWPARVTWCGLDPEDGYHAGLRLEAKASPNQESGDTSAKTPNPAVQDYYEVLQLNPKADPDTIHRVYRLLAQRLHPDNRDSGSEQLFRQLIEAYRVLSDPEQRAAYDVRLNESNKRRWKIFDQVSAAHGTQAERRKRAGILSVLYTRRLNEPAQPAMTLPEIEDLLGCPREHLEFSLWFLKEKGWIGRGDNGRFHVTVAGAEEAERTEIPVGREDRMLESPR